MLCKHAIRNEGLIFLIPYEYADSRSVWVRGKWGRARVGAADSVLSYLLAEPDSFRVISYTGYSSIFLPLPRLRFVKSKQISARMIMQRSPPNKI